MLFQQLFFRIPVLILLLFSAQLSAQGEATLLFLRIPPSPAINGIGRAGVALPGSESFAMHYNPAHLGYMSREQNLAFQFYPVKTDWLPRFNLSNLYFDASAGHIGYDFGNHSSRLPLSLGVGFIRSRINYGENIQTDVNGNEIARFRSAESYSGVAMGASYGTNVNVSVGFTIKGIESQLSPLQTDNSDGRVETTATDVGILLNVPILKFREDRINPDTGKPRGLQPYASISLGYAMTNIGGRVSYVEGRQSDPIPRTAELGYAFSGGFELRTGVVSLKAMDFVWSVESSDIMVNSEDQEYKSGLLGDIGIFSNLIALDGDGLADVYYGFRVDMLEFFQVSFGSFGGPGWSGQETFGIGVRSLGFFKLLAMASGNRSLSALANKFDIQFFRSEVLEPADHPLTGTTEKSVMLTIRNISF